MFPSQALVKRELITTLRRRRVFVWLLLLFVCCIGAVWLNWPRPGDAPYAVARSMTDILSSLSAILLAGCLLFIPAAAAGAIVAEREQDTLDLLRMSLVRGSGIVVAKLLNAIGLFLLFVVTIAPAIGASLFGVGLERVVVAQVFIVLAAVALTCALSGLACSAFFRKTIWAVIASYATAFAALAIPSLLAALFLLSIYFYPEVFVNVAEVLNANEFVLDSLVVDGEVILALASPPSALALAFDQGSLSGWWILVSVALQTPFWLLFALLSLRWLRKRDTYTIVDSEQPIDDLEILKARREQFPYYLLDPLKRKEPIEDARNPMFVREVRWGLFSRLTTLMRLCLAIFAMFFIAALFPVFYDSGRMGDSDIIRMWAAAQYFITMLFAPALVANTFTKERELGNFDMMRMTLLSPRQILAGKAAAGMVVLTPVVVAVLIASIPLLFIGVRALPELGMSVVTGVVWAAFCVSISIVVSLSVKRTIGALIASYAIVAFTFLVLNFLVEFLWVSHLNRTDPNYFARLGMGYRELAPPWVDAITALNPATAVLGQFGDISWPVNTGVAIGIIAGCYAVASFILARFRMQDR